VLRLVLQDGGGVNLVPALEVRILEQLPAVPKIFDLGVRGRTNGGAAALPFAGLDVDGVGDQIDL